MSIVDFTSKVLAILRGDYPLFPRILMAMMASRERRDERIEKKVKDLIIKIRGDEKKGEVSKLTKDEKDMISNLLKEAKIEAKEIKGEEELEMKLAYMLEELVKAVKTSKRMKNNQEVLSKIIGIIKAVESFTRTQMNDLEQVKGGGWPVRIAKAPLDMGESSNVAITTARAMRADYGKIKTGISKTATIVRLADAAKNPEDQIKKIKDMLNDLNGVIIGRNGFLQKMDDHFVMMIRIFRFFVDEVNDEKNHLKVMEQEGLSKATADRINKGMDEALKKFHKSVSEEAVIAQRVIQKEERDLAEAA